MNTKYKLLEERFRQRPSMWNEERSWGWCKETRRTQVYEAILRLILRVLGSLWRQQAEDSCGSIHCVMKEDEVFVVFATRLLNWNVLISLSPHPCLSSPRSETLSVTSHLLTLFYRPLDCPLVATLLSGQFSSPQMQWSLKHVKLMSSIP